MTGLLSVYLSNHHDWASTWGYIRALDPAWVRIHQPSARDIHQVQQAAPAAQLMLRSWDIDDHNGDRKRELYADPRGAARRHLDLWLTKLDDLTTEMRRNGWQPDTDRWYIGLVNEPDPAYVPQVVEYSREAMRLVEGTPLRLGLVCSSVGTFMKPGEGDAGWTQFIPLARPIQDGGHILIVHEYWQPEGPHFGEDAGNLAWRHRHIPLDVPILIGEAGANGYIYGRHSQHDDAGWQKFMSPDQYAAQVQEYIDGCDTRVEGVCLYMTDYHSDQWQSFDTTPAHGALLGIRQTRPSTTYIPVVSSGPTAVAVVGTIATPAGANIRQRPVDGPVVIAVPYGEQVTITGTGDRAGWVQVRYGSHEGWMAAHLISLGETTPPPSSPPAGDTWTRSYAFVRRWEGGYQNVHNDAGNWTGGQVGVGELKGTNFGISAASYPHLDIKGLTPQQAEQIYRTDYWQRSGADRQPWPLCLLVFDTAVLHGVGTAMAWLQEAGPDPFAFAARRLRIYTKMENWDFWGKAWVNRVADLLEEMSQ